MYSTSNKPLSRRRSLLLIAALIVAEMVAIFEGSMIYAAMRAFYKEFGDPIAVGWILTAFLLASASTAPVLGRLADMYGRRRLALIALSFSVAGSLISGFSETIAGVIVGRAVQGCTSAILPISYGLLREHLTRDWAVNAIGVVATVMTVGAGVGIFAGGLIVDHLSWEWIFYLSAGIAALAFVLVLLFVPPSAPAPGKERVDMAGAVFFAASISSLLYAISAAKGWGWHDPRVWALVAVGVVGLAGWCVYELRIQNPMIDLRLLASRQPALANLAMVAIAMGPLQAVSFITLLMQQPVETGVGLGISATTSGLMLFAAQCFGLLGGPLAARTIRLRSPRAALTLGASLLLAGWIGIALYHGSGAFIVAMMAFACLGQAVSMAAVPMLILDAVPASRTSEATSIITTLRPIAMGVGVQLASYLVAQSMVSTAALNGESYPDGAAFSLLFGCVAVACLLSIVCARALPAGVVSHPSSSR